MKYRTRAFYTDKQKSEMWDRWQQGESLSSIGRRFDRASSSIFPHLALTGGIRPPARTRSWLALPPPILFVKDNGAGLADQTEFLFHLSNRRAKLCNRHAFCLGRA